MPGGRPKTTYICQSCGRQSPKWLGHCPTCDQWNTYIEAMETPVKDSYRSLGNAPQAISRVSSEQTPRIFLSSREFNRVLGGGVVPGSLILIGGDPGIGKSTLLLQVVASVAEGDQKVLYVSGEESVYQLKLRGDRLGLKAEGLYLLSETNLESIIHHLEEMSPRLAVIDSIQTIYLEGVESSIGSLAQVRECTVRLMHWAKTANVPIFITGHVTKDGVIAGPRMLEHIVDVVLYLEGESFGAYRLLRGVKNRFGSTNEVGVFEMRDEGLVEVEDPSRTFLAERSEQAIGSAVVPTLEGTRPLLVEIQALTSYTSFSLPRRVANGVDFNRLLLVIAVLVKRVGLALSNQDIIASVVGGLKVNEPAADLGVALAIASSFRDRRINPDLVAVGEVGLSGELRAVTHMERRLGEATKLGFRRCLVPKSTVSRVKAAKGIECIGVSSLAEALKVALA